MSFHMEESIGGCLRGGGIYSFRGRVRLGRWEEWELGVFGGGAAGTASECRAPREELSFHMEEPIGGCLREGGIYSFRGRVRLGRWVGWELGVLEGALPERHRSAPFFAEASKGKLRSQGLSRRRGRGRG